MSLLNWFLSIYIVWCYWSWNLKVISFSKCLLLYIKIQLSFIILTLYPVNLLNYLLVPAVVLQILGIFYVNNRLTVNKESFTSSFSDFCAFIFFLCLIAKIGPGRSKAVLTEVVKPDTLTLFTTLGRKCSIFHH